MNTNQSRRSFFGKTALAGSAALTGVRPAVAQSRRRKSSVELLQVGAACLGDNSHMNYEIWAPCINPEVPDKWYGRTTGMRITHCWDKDPEIAAAFAKKYKCEAVKDYDGMVGKVDGMIYAGFNEVKWWPKLAKPYLEAGIPCHLNRPFAYSMKDAKEIVRLSKENNAPILCTDEREYIKESITARGKVEQLLKEGKTILGANSDNAATEEYPQHGIHGLYYMLAILGLDVEQVSLQADSWWREKTKTSPKKTEYSLLTLQYNGIDIPGVGKQTKKFMAAQQELPDGYGSNANMRIYYDGGWWDIDNHWTENNRDMRMYTLFFPTILMMQKLFETREMPWSHEYILKKTQIFLAGFKSHLEHNGGFVKVSDITDDWEAPCPYPDWIDESIFG